jgi:predicted lactoylglutathione lyase
MIFVNLAVKDLPRSRAFFDALGFTFNEKFSDDTAACMVVSDTIFVMLLTEAKFQGFTPKSMVDAHSSTEVMNCLSCDSREEVDSMVAKAKAAGGTTFNEPKDYGFMYYHAFSDPDGHIWEIMWMDPAAAVDGCPEAAAAASSA